MFLVPRSCHLRAATPPVQVPLVPSLGLALWLFLLAGCAHYQFGTPTLFPTDIRTVYVPVFESNSFRRQLGERLTEAVVREIESHTPYKVVSSQNADSVLSGRITQDTKRVLIESPTDEPRQLELNFQVEVSWIDRRGAPLQEPLSVPLPNTLVPVGQAQSVVPEAGQSIAQSQQDAIDRLAQQIVALMELPW